jgi:tetratricopeptide (TPR) repeat protein
MKLRLSEKYKKIVLVWAVLLLALSFLSTIIQVKYVGTNSAQEKTPVSEELIFKKNSPTPSPIPVPMAFEIPLRSHIFQRFNNCGPASLSMALSYFDINISQEEIGKDLRPYQNAIGNNDDKSVTLEELAQKGEELGFVTYHRPNGNIDLLKKLISQNIPVITRTITKPGEDIGHYRLIRGYTESEIIQDDSLQGKGLKYTYEGLNVLWKQFNYEYLVLVPKEKVSIAENFLGEEVDEKLSWQKAVVMSKELLQQDPNDIFAGFNLSVALYNTGEFEKSVVEFEKVEQKLPFRTLWYQIEPILAYYELKEYDRVFEITDNILNNENRAFSELYIIRGDIYKSQGNLELAKSEYEKAVLYNKNMAEAQTRINALD